MAPTVVPSEPAQAVTGELRPLTSVPVTVPTTPWLLATEAAEYIRTSPKTVYREARAGRIRHARVGGRRELRFRREWLDEWLEATTTPVEVRRG